MKRFGALVAAVLLVVIALWVRGRIGGGDGIRLGGGEPTGTIVCSTELARACESIRERHPTIAITIEASGATAAALAAAESGATPAFDVWLVAQPYAAVATELLKASTGPPVLDTASAPIAHSRLGLFVHESRADALASHCGQVGWNCVLAAVSGPGTWAAIGGQAAWGPLKPHISEPTESSGLVALGGAAVGVLGPEPDSLGIRESADFGSALAALKRARTLAALPSTAALSRMLAAGPSQVDIVAGLEAEGHRFGAAASKARLVYPAPVVSAEVVAVPRRGSEAARDLIDLLASDEGREALVSTGWRAGRTPAASAGSPSTGSHIALRRLWEETR